ncbi:IWS1 transcription elongation factor [Spraguea lophii 42_110]|uniref:IWS1 transcription elongation factor n=1 Tax=Spraguea lophii (strain 42_110) TaxID=1358809 RepID=S7WA54_SPRLO|nr:IWS1 transcription elongation factor [Spraguea lophii 42_110]
MIINSDDESLIKQENHIINSNDNKSVDIKKSIQKKKSKKKDSDDDRKESMEIKRKFSKSKKIKVDVEGKTIKVIDRMKYLLEEDIKLNKEKKAALNRINNLDEIMTDLNYKPFYDTLLKNGILNHLKMWLEPLPDNSLPNHRIKKEILGLLYRMPVRREHLLQSDVGKIINFYSKNLFESKDIRHLAKDLVKKWTMMLYNN